EKEEIGACPANPGGDSPSRDSPRCTLFPFFIPFHSFSFLGRLDLRVARLRDTRVASNCGRFLGSDPEKSGCRPRRRSDAHGPVGSTRILARGRGIRSGVPAPSRVVSSEPSRPADASPRV